MNPCRDNPRVAPVAERENSASPSFRQHDAEPQPLPTVSFDSQDSSFDRKYKAADDAMSRLPHRRGSGRAAECPAEMGVSSGRVESSRRHTVRKGGEIHSVSKDRPSGLRGTIAKELEEGYS